MEIKTILEIITNIGFPIACVICMGYFIFYMTKKITEMNETNMQKIEEQCRAREDRLFEERKENRKVNSKAIETIAHYAEKLDVIQSDISDIKHDLTVIMVGDKR